jgi:PHD/YefM family antitoxin component YafN of YafNO toxin-antitoxin module
MNSISFKEFEEGIEAAISKSEKSPVRIRENGKTLAVLVNPNLLKRMLDALEEQEDIAEFDAAVAKRSPREKLV